MWNWIFAYVQRMDVVDNQRRQQQWDDDNDDNWNESKWNEYKRQQNKDGREELELNTVCTVGVCVRKCVWVFM